MAVGPCCSRPGLHRTSKQERVVVKDALFVTTKNSSEGTPVPVVSPRAHSRDLPYPKEVPQS